MKTMILATLISNILNIANFFSGVDPENWDLDTQKENINIYSQQGTQDKFRTFKVEAKMDSGLERIEATLDDLSHLVAWFPMASTATLVSRETSSDLIVYLTFDFPFPMKDRDAYIRIRKKAHSDHFISYQMEIAPRYPVHGNFERITELTSITMLESSLDEVVLSQITYLNPGGNVPKLFLHGGLPPVMLKSFKKLQELIGN